jgi:hypothetical protein
MSDEEFVKSIYPTAKYISYVVRQRGYKNVKDSAIVLETKPKYKSVGLCTNKTKEETWRYARTDLEIEMLEKLES